MFSCRDATNVMTEEADGALVGGARVKYRIHMFICGHCRTYRRQLAEAIRLVKSMGDARDAVPSEVEDRLVDAFRARARKSG